VLATEPKGCGFEPGQGDGFLRTIKIRSTPSFGWEVKPEVPCRKILWHVKDFLKSLGDVYTKFSFSSPTSHSLQRCLGWQETRGYWWQPEMSLLAGNQTAVGAATEMSLLTGPPDRAGGCQSALVDELGVSPLDIVIHGPHRKSPGDEQRAHRGRHSETSVSPHHSQSIYQSTLNWEPVYRFPFLYL
jgi:hypothetical protein